MRIKKCAHHLKTFGRMRHLVCWLVNNSVITIITRGTEEKNQTKYFEQCPRAQTKFTSARIPPFSRRSDCNCKTCITASSSLVIEHFTLTIDSYCDVVHICLAQRFPVTLIALQPTINMKYSIFLRFQYAIRNNWFVSNNTHRNRAQRTDSIEWKIFTIFTSCMRKRSLPSIYHRSNKTTQNRS